MSTSGSDEISPKLDDGLKGGGLDERAESAGPPLAPADMPLEGHALRESAEGSPDGFHESTPIEQPALAAPVADHSSASEKNFRPGGKLIAGTAIGVGLALAALAYFFVPFRGEKAVTASRTEQPATIRSEPAAPPASPTPAPQPRANIPESPPASPSPSTPVRAPTAASPEPTAPPPAAPAPIRPAQPPTAPAEAPAQVAPGAPAAAPPAPLAPAQVAPPPSTPVAPTPPATNNAALRPPAAVPQGRQILFLQRPGVNIRSNPSTGGSVVGSAPQGTRFEVTNRNGEWVQVESGRLKGWINARFLGANPPP